MRLCSESLRIFTYVLGIQRCNQIVGYAIIIAIIIVITIMDIIVMLVSYFHSWQWWKHETGKNFYLSFGFTLHLPAEYGFLE